MLQSMRDKMQGLIAGTIAVIIALTFALWGIQNYLRSGTDHAIAKVNGEEITQEQLRSSYERVKRNEIGKFGPGFSLDQKMQVQIKQNILQQLINELVIFQAETKMGLGVSKKQLLAIIGSMPIFQIDGHFSASRFQQLVHGVFRSEGEFLDGMERSILREQLRGGIVNSTFVLPSEIELIRQIFKQQRDFGYFVVSPERFAKTVKITEDDIKKYYDQHQSDFLLPEKVSIQYLELSSNNPLIMAVKSTEEQLKQFYHSHINSFSTPKKWHATRILLPLPLKSDVKANEVAKKKMEELVVLVKDKSDLVNIAPGVKVITSWMIKGETSPDFIAHLDKLTAGQVTSVFRNKDGYNLVKVLEVQPVKVTPYEKVTAKVKQMYEQEQLAKAFTEASDKLADLVYTNSDSLEPAAKNLGLKIQETELFANVADVNRKGILANNKVIKLAFSDAVLKQRYNSNLTELGVGKVVVIRIKDHVPEKVQSLDQVREIILQKLQKQAVNVSAANLADELLKALRSGKTEVQLARQYGLVWRQIVGAKYGQEGENAKLVDAVFDLTKPKDKEASALVVNLNDSYAVLRLDKITNDTAYKNNQKMDSVLKSLPERLGELDYQLLLKNLMSKAKIETFDNSKNEDKE